MPNDSPQTDQTIPPAISRLIDDIVAGKVSVSDFIGSAPSGDYQAHVEMMRTFGVISNDLRVLKALRDETQRKIVEYVGDVSSSEDVEKQLLRKDGHRRFEKLMVQRDAAFTGRPSLLSGKDFETCLAQYKTLLAHVEGSWASAAQEFKMGNFPIAAFLAILVIEEIGKLGRLPQDLTYYNVPRIVLRSDAVERDHRRKHYIGVVSGALINARLDRILGKDVVKKLLHEAESDEFEKTRQACLYIDIKDGIPVTPAEQISEERARTLVILAGELMAEVLGHFPWEFERMLDAVMTFEEQIGIPLKKVARR
jgi:AbiV family abortive infection protein